MSENNLKNVKDFVERCFVAEADAYTAYYKVSNLDQLNKKIENFYSFSIVNLSGKISLSCLTKAEDNEFYERFKNALDVLPRFLFKISAYRHPNHGDVFVAYCSSANPRPTQRRLVGALFIIESSGELKIAQYCLYSNFDSDGVEYCWSPSIYGLDDLLFENLQGPFEIERYLEPKDSFDGHENYYANI